MVVGILGFWVLAFWIAQIGDGFGGDLHGSQRGRAWWRWGWILMGFSIVTLVFFLILFLIWVFVPVGFRWVVSSGGMVGWWRCGGGDWAVKARC